MFHTLKIFYSLHRVLDDLDLEDKEKYDLLKKFFRLYLEDNTFLVTEEIYFQRGPYRVTAQGKLKIIKRSNGNIACLYDNIT